MKTNSDNCAVYSGGKKKKKDSLGGQSYGKKIDHLITQADAMTTLTKPECILEEQEHAN